jgi:hypothetical protein
MDYLVPWLTSLILSLGYVGLSILVALGNIRIVPIPAELTLPLAGLLVGEGQLAFLPVLLWTTVASDRLRNLVSARFLGWGGVSTAIHQKVWTLRVSIRVGSEQGL